MKTLSGYVVMRNADRLDYCWRLAVESLLPVCDEVIICDSDSEDGSREDALRMAADNPKIRVVNWPWLDPVGESHHAFVRWLNYARSHLTTDCQITLDADEVLDDNPLCHRVILDALKTDSPGRFFHRLNFWRDLHSLIPHGVCCGWQVARMGLADRAMHSDEPRTDDGGDWRILDEAVFHPDLKIFHLGFLRRKEAFYRKARAIHRIWNGEGIDSRLAVGEEKGLELWETQCDFANLLTPYTGTYPESVVKWLAERGH